MTHLDTAGVTRSLGGASYQKEETGSSFPDIFAQYAKAYSDQYGDPTLAMAHIAVKNHLNAMRNPLAQMHKLLDLDARHVRETVTRPGRRYATSRCIAGHGRYHGRRGRCDLCLHS